MDKNNGKILKKTVVWKELYFYRKSDAIYQLTTEFCRRFLPLYGDRTVDQMVQAARSGKQNIIEGSENGTTSSEMEIKLLNVARGSLQELRADYQDYLNSHKLPIWGSDNDRLQPLIDFCSKNNDYEAYEPLTPKMKDVEFANLMLTLLHQTDRLMCAYIEQLEKKFVEEGGIKERMYSARTNYRQKQVTLLNNLQIENKKLKEQNQALQKKIEYLESLLEKEKA